MAAQTVDDMPRAIQPAALEDYAAHTLHVTFAAQMQQAMRGVEYSAADSTHNAVLRALEKAGIDNELPITQIVTKIRLSKIHDDPALQCLCSEWENYRKQLFAANNTILRAVTTIIERGAYDEVMNKVTFANCFRHKLWMSKRIDLREDQFPAMNGDKIDQFIDAIEHDGKKQQQSTNWQSEAPQLWREIEQRVLGSFGRRRRDVLIARYQNFQSHFWKSQLQMLQTSRDAKVRTIEQMATSACLPGVAPRESLHGLVDKFREKWTRLFNKGQCSFAQVQQFIDTEAKDVAQIKTSNEESLRKTDYSAMQHNYTCAFAVHEWLAMACDFTTACRKVVQERDALHGEIPNLVQQLIQLKVLEVNNNNTNESSSIAAAFVGAPSRPDSKRSSSSAGSEQGPLWLQMAAHYEHEELAFIGRIKQAQQNLKIINDLTDVRRKAFQQAVLLDYALFVFHIIELLKTHQADYKESLGSMDSGNSPAAAAAVAVQNGVGEQKADEKQQQAAVDRDRVYLEEYNRYIIGLREILGLDQTGNRQEPFEMTFVIESPSIDTLLQQELLQTGHSHKELEPNRRTAIELFNEAFRPLEKLLAVDSEIQRQLLSSNRTQQMDWQFQKGSYESGTKIQGWTSWIIDAKHVNSMPDVAQKLHSYVDHIRRIYPHAFGGMQSQLLGLEQASLNATAQAAADLGLSFKRVKLLAQPKQTTAIGNMLHSQQKIQQQPTDNKEDWDMQSVVQIPEGAISVSKFLTILTEWIEIATVCALFKGNSGYSTPSSSSASSQSQSRKRKPPTEWTF